MRLGELSGLGSKPDGLMCPRCGSEELSCTLAGYMGPWSADGNTCRCPSCKWEGAYGHALVTYALRMQRSLFREHLDI